jgi:endoglucanase
MNQWFRSLLIAIPLSIVCLALNTLTFPCIARDFSEPAFQPVVLGAVLTDKTIWESYKRRFVADDGRVIDTGNGGVSHSEGQGYGMLIAVAAADRLSFDKIWKWTRINLITRGDHLAAWKWDTKSNKVADTNNATDGDLLIAWALAEAAELWNDRSHLEEARAIAHDIFDEAVQARTPHGPLLMPAARGFSANDRREGPIVNLSYWVFPAFARLAQLTPELDWRGVARSGLALIEKARFGDAFLPTDWISLANRVAVPASGFPKVAGYNAIRIPLYLVWSGAVDARRLRPFAEAWGSSNAGVPLIDLDANVADEWLREPGYRALAALTHCIVSNVPYPDAFYRFTANQNYYPATLHILSMLAAANTSGSCLDHAVMRRLVDLAWRPKADAPAESLLPSSPPILTSLKAASLARPASSMDKARFRTSDPQTDAADREPKNYSTTLAIGALFVVLGFFLFLRRRFASDASGDAHEQFLDEAVSAIRKGVSDGSFSLAPRVLPNNPFTELEYFPLLEQRIEIAAEACVRLSRTVGLIYLEVPGYMQMETQHGRSRAREAMSSLVSELQRSLRATDHVELLDGNRILVCACLLASLDDLQHIARRLRSVIQRLGLADERGVMPSAGLSIYPLNGYSGTELMQAAQEDFRRAAEAAEGFASSACSQLFLAAPTARPEKAGPRKRTSSKTASAAGSRVKKAASQTLPKIRR